MTGKALVSDSINPTDGKERKRRGTPTPTLRARWKTACHLKQPEFTHSRLPKRIQIAEHGNLSPSRPGCEAVGVCTGRGSPPLPVTQQQLLDCHSISLLWQCYFILHWWKNNWELGWGSENHKKGIQGLSLCIHGIYTTNMQKLLEHATPEYTNPLWEESCRRLEF